MSNMMLDIVPKKLRLGDLAFVSVFPENSIYVRVCVCQCAHAYSPVLLKGRRSKSVWCVCEYVGVYLHAYLGEPKKTNLSNLTQIIVC